MLRQRVLQTIYPRRQPLVRAQGRINRLAEKITECLPKERERGHHKKREPNSPKASDRQ